MSFFSKKIKKFKTFKWYYLLIVLLAFLSDDSYWAATSGNNYLSLARYAFVVALPIIFMAFLKVNVGKDIKTLLILIIAGIFIASLISGSGMGGPIMLFFSLVSAALIVTKVDISIFSARFCEVVVVMILYSFVLQMLIMVGLLQVRTIENVIGANLSMVGGCIFHNSYFGLIMRNGCIFREPGVFMVYITMAYVLDIWLNKGGLTLRRQLIYFLGEFSTMSTAGMIIWAFLFVINILKKGSFKAKNLIPMVIVVIVAYFIFSNEIIYGNVFAKLDRGTDSASVLGRLSSVVIPLKMTLNSPLWGCGTENFRDVYIHYGKELFHTEIDPQGLATNAILNASAVFGLWFGIFIILGFWRLSEKLSAGNVLGCFLTFLSIVMTFSNESMQYSLIFYLLIFYGYRKRKKSKSRNIKYIIRSILRWRKMSQQSTKVLVEGYISPK